MDAGGSAILALVPNAAPLEALWALAWSGLWMGALAATLLAVVVSALARWTSLRPATRHALWFAVLLSFITPAIAGSIWRPTWFASDRLAPRTPVVGLPIAPTPAAESEGKSERASVPLSPGNPIRPNAEPATPARRDVAANNAIRAHTQELPVASCDAPSVDTACSPSASTVGSSSCAEASTTPTSVCGEEVTDIALLLAASTTRAPDHVLEPIPEPAEEAAQATQASRWKSDAARQAASNSLLPTSASLRFWLARLLDVRDAIAALPPIPMVLWAAGAIAVCVAYLVRIRRIRGILRRAIPAEAHIEREVLQVARSLGLERAPHTLITNEAISPLVWCGMRPCLVLPADLWESFDRHARRTVLVHELAHVRRGDHRMAWLEAAIAVLYWWHPIAWWARSRLRDSAEAACDTWVTAVCPQNRRSYAEAIVLATSFLSNTSDRTSRSQQAACASVSVGFVSGRSRRLARRITMIMTTRFAPRMSLVGTAAALVAIGLGAFVAPSIACPPTECEAQASAAANLARAAAKQAEVAAKARVKGTRAPRPAAQSGGNPFVGEAPAIDAMGQPFSATSPSGLGGVAVVGQPLDAIIVQGQPLQGLSTSSGVAVAGVDLFDSSETIVRPYSLPEGKLEALLELMAREDVPVLIENGGDQILLHGTPRQHEIFSAFVHLIHPDGHAAMPQVRRGQPLSGNAFTTVPGFKMSATAMDQAKAELQAALRQRESIERDAERLREQAEEARERADELREAYSNLAEQRSNMARFGDEQTERALLEAMRSLENRAISVAREADAIEAKAQSSESRMESLESAIERLEERLEALAEALEGAGIEVEEVEEAEEAADTAASLEATDVSAAAFEAISRYRTDALPPMPASPAAFPSMPTTPIPPVAPAAPVPSSR